MSPASSSRGARPAGLAAQHMPHASPAAAASPTQPGPQPGTPATASSLYRDAEAALAARDLALADRRLASLLTQFPESALLDQALYERARIAYQRHAWTDAQRQLDQLATISASPLAEPGAYLACRIAFEASDRGAQTCLVNYRTRYPHSPHDLEVLGLLTELAYRDGGCASARARTTELIRLYTDTALADGWRHRCPVVP